MSFKDIKFTNPFLDLTDQIGYFDPTTKQMVYTKDYEALMNNLIFINTATGTLDAIRKDILTRASFMPSELAVMLQEAGLTAVYRNDVSYNNNAVVQNDGYFFKSAIDSNVGGNLSATLYSGIITYDLNNQVSDSSGNIYISLQDGNIGHNLTDTDWWKLLWIKLGDLKTTDIITISQFANSKTTNGYTYLPNGLIFQWGEAQVIPDSTGVPITLPITFSNANLVCYATSREYPFNNAAINIGNKSLSGFNITSYSPIGTFQASLVTWFAVGY